MKGEEELCPFKLNSTQLASSHPKVANTRKEAQCEVMYIPIPKVAVNFFIK